MSCRSLLLLDVDGVLQPLGRSVPRGFERFTTADSEVVLHVEHGRWLNELTALYEVVWATTWGANANRLIGARLGLPSFGHIELGSMPREGTRKLGAVKQFVGDRAVAWIDDELYDDALDWAQHRTAPTLLVRTAGSVGLNESHVEQLQAFGQATGQGTLDR